MDEYGEKFVMASATAGGFLMGLAYAGKRDSNLDAQDFKRQYADHVATDGKMTVIDAYRTYKQNGTLTQVPDRIPEDFNG